MDQTKAGVILSYASEAVKILSSLLYTPIMLRLLGQSEYGLYQLVNSVVAYLGLLSLGFGSAYLRFYFRYKVKKNEEEIARLNGMFMTIFCCISVICVFCGLLMLGNIRLLFGTGLSSTEYTTARILMIFMIFNMALTFPNSVFSCIVTAHEKFVFQKILIILQNLLNPFLTLPLLLLGYGSVGMVIVASVLTLANIVTNAFFCLKKLKVRFVFRGFSFALLKEMWIFTFFIFINQIVDQANWNVDKYLLGRFTGTTSVAVYGVGWQIYAMYSQFSTSVSGVFVPKVNRIVAEEDNNQSLTELFTKVGRIQFIIMFLVLTGFIFFGQSFIFFWAGKEYKNAYYVALFLTAPAIVPLIQNLGIEIQRAKNKHKVRSVVYLFIAIGNVFISIPLIKVFGVSGAAFGTAVAIIMGHVLFMNWYYHEKIGLDMISFWKSILSFIPALILPCAVGAGWGYFVSVKSITVLIIGIIGYVGVYCLSMWLWGMNREEKEMIHRFLNKILRKRCK